MRGDVKLRAIGMSRYLSGRDEYKVGLIEEEG